VHLYLASTSPRRRELLTRAGIAFTCVPPGPEPEDAGDPPALALARARSKCVGAEVPPGAAPGCVLGVDTVVDVDGVEFGKPKDRDDAQRMLRQFAGRVHLVHTGHCVRMHNAAGQLREALTTARVLVRPLTPAEITAYLDSREWEGKAGAYGIQGLAAQFCTVLDGDVDTVIGMSVSAVQGLLRAAIDVRDA
jgi:septum formation protein